MESSETSDNDPDGLEELLAEAQFTNDQYKVNYQKLKGDHARLQSEHVKLEENLRDELRRSQQVNADLNSMIKELTLENELLVQKVDDNDKQIFPDEHESLQARLNTDVILPLRAKLQDLENEVDRYRTESNALRRDYLFLETEHKRYIEQSQRLLTELASQHEVEMTQLREERDQLLLSQREGHAVDVEKLRNLQKENLTLNQKVIEMRKELEEMRSETETLHAQGGMVNHMQQRHMMELKTNLQTVMTESESIRSQLKSTQSELESTTTQNIELTGRFHSLEQEKAVLQGKVEELSLRIEMAVSNAKLDAAKERAEIEKEHSTCGERIKALNEEIENLKSLNDRMKHDLTESELQSVNRVQTAKEEGKQQVHTLMIEKLEMEHKIESLNRQLVDADSSLSKDLQNAKSSAQGFHLEKVQLQKEIQSLKNRIEQYESLNGDRATQRERILQMDQELKASRKQIEDLNALNQKLQNELSSFASETDTLRQQAIDVQNEVRRQLAGQKSGIEGERKQMALRITELERQLIEAKQNAEKNGKLVEKYKARASSIVKQLKNSLQISKAKNEKFSAEIASLKDRIPVDEYKRLVTELREMKRRHREFSSLLATDVVEVNIADRNFSAILMPDGKPEGVVSQMTEIGGKARTKEIWRRIENLENEQRKQMEALDPTYHPKMDDGATETVEHVTTTSRVVETFEERMDL